MSSLETASVLVVPLFQASRQRIRVVGAGSISLKAAASLTSSTPQKMHRHDDAKYDVGAAWLTCEGLTPRQVLAKGMQFPEALGILIRWLLRHPPTIRANRR